MKQNIDEIIIYGSGQRGSGLYILLNNNHIRVKYVIDTNVQKWNTPFYDTVISSPDVLLGDDKTLICIAIAREEDAISVRTRLNREYGVDAEREIGYFDLVWDLYQRDMDIQTALKKETALGSPQYIFECDYGLGLGGIEAWTKSICTELLLDGRKNLHIISDRGEYDIPDILEDKVVNLPINHNEMFATETMVRIIEHLLQQLPCVVVTGQFYMTLLAACLVKQHYPKQIHIISVIHFGKDELYRQYASVKSYIDLYIGVSRDITEGLLQYGVEKNKVDHMTCPVECDRILERDYTLDREKPIRLGYAGRMNKKQKRMDLIPAFVSFLENLQVNYFFEIAGKGDYCGKLEEFIEERGLGDKIRLIGSVARDAIGDFWKDKDVCLSFSDYEGRSISIMEAMANGAVPVVTATSGVRDDITDDENGYIVGLQDIETMAEKVCYLEVHRERISTMGKKAHDCIYPKCRMKEHLKYWERLLDEKVGEINEKKGTSITGI